MSSKECGVRTCVACRQRDQKTKLLRFVSGEEMLEFDEQQVRDGRGVYVHPACWDAYETGAQKPKRGGLLKLMFAKTVR
ncbi:MAG: YlxR family protein [Bdellovibrionales bacterium]|nr:YlxR family protein [Bdellovibrionales bacterium]